jgi:hypothetical protein
MVWQACGKEMSELSTARELWGWPVEVLDRLRELPVQAWDGEISLEQWREEDAAARVGRPVVDRDEISKLRITWIEDPPEDVPDDVQQVVTTRLAALIQPAPSDDELWGQLERFTEMMNDPDMRRTDVAGKLRSRRFRVESWLTRAESGVDMQSGLPWSLIAQYRVVDEPGVGPVPQHVDAARRLALSGAPEQDRKRAHLLVGERERKIADVAADMNQHILTWLPRTLRDAAVQDAELGPVLADQLAIWTDPRVQRLLMAETAGGWPVAWKDAQVKP